MYLNDCTLYITTNKYQFCQLVKKLHNITIYKQYLAKSFKLFLWNFGLGNFEDNFGKNQGNSELGLGLILGPKTPNVTFQQWGSYPKTKYL